MKSTELDLANTSPSDQKIAIALFGGDGSVQDTYTTTLPAKAQLVSRIEGLFPSIPPGFSGYAVAAGRQTLSASSFQWTNTTVTGIAAQAINDVSLSATSLYAPQLGGSNIFNNLAAFVI